MGGLILGPPNRALPLTGRKVHLPVMVRFWVWTTVPRVAVIVTVFVTWLRNVLIGNVALLDPAGMITALWTRTTAESLLDRPTTTSEEVILFSVTVAVRTVPPGTGEGKVRESRARGDE